MQHGLQFMSSMMKVLEKIQATQQRNIEKAAETAATSIAGDDWCNLFGTGHSHLPCIDAYPRIGSYPGFRPMVELALSTPNYMVTDNGLLQGTFLEQVPGYGDVILQSHQVEPPDCMIIFSNSGVNAVPIDIALGCRRRGVPVIAITSVAHSSSTNSRHASGKRLMDIADLVIDNCMPPGDALVSIEGLEHNVASGSTLASVFIIQAIVAETAAKLTRMGKPPLVLHSHNRRDAQEEAAHTSVELNVQEYGRRLGRRLSRLDTRMV